MEFPKLGLKVKLNYLKTVQEFFKSEATLRIANFILFLSFLSLLLLNAIFNELMPLEAYEAVTKPRPTFPISTTVIEVNFGIL